MNLDLAFSIFMTFGDIAKYQDKRLLAALSGINVNPAQYIYLFTICENREMNVSELAQVLHVENSTASVTIKRMETAGLVTRKVDKYDSRMMRVSATALGLEQFNLAKLIITDYIGQIFGGFSNDEINDFYHTLTKVCENIQHYSPKKLT